jgi:hypothetical protein
MHRILSKADGYRGTAARKKTDAGRTKYSDKAYIFWSVSIIRIDPTIWPIRPAPR